jgi:hypothetical protein
LPGFSRNMPDTVRGIPFAGKADGVRGNLRSGTEALFARGSGRPDGTSPSDGTGERGLDRALGDPALSRRGVRPRRAAPCGPLRRRPGDLRARLRPRRQRGAHGHRRPLRQRAARRTRPRHLGPGPAHTGPGRARSRQQPRAERDKPGILHGKTAPAGPARPGVPGHAGRAAAPEGRRPSSPYA